MSEPNGYKFLEPRPYGNYRQLYVKGRKIRAVILCSQTLGEDGRTPEEVARDYDLPVEAVLEAIHYCTHHADVVRADSEMEEADIREYERRYNPPKPSDYPERP